VLAGVLQLVSARCRFGHDEIMRRELICRTSADRQFGRPYFVPTMQRATPGILTLPSSS
jgi:hypothetical protein